MNRFDTSSFASQPLLMMGVVACLALAPLAVMMLTSFSKMAVVLSLVRSALGSQQAPPTLVLTGLAAVLSAPVMAPVLERMYAEAAQGAPAAREGENLLGRAARIAAPLRAFLLKHAGEEERLRFAAWSEELRQDEARVPVDPTSWAVLVPSFVVTELKEAFQMGFLLFLPFLVLDMLVASVLLALGMQTLSPSQVSLPFKILLFVSVDGWSLLSRGLLLGYR